MLLPVLLAPAAGRAAEWTAAPSVNLRREYNDNLRLSTFPHKSVNGSIITPALDLGVAMPRWRIGLGAQATQRRYSGQEGLDRDDSLLRLSSLYNTERSTWQLGASHARSASVTSEEIDSDTGAVQTQISRETDSVNPSWSWMYSRRTRLQLSYQQTDVAYGGNARNTGLFDYRNKAATAVLSNQVSEINQIFFSGGYSEFNVPVTGLSSETLNLQAGFTRNFSETTTGTLQAGRRRTDSVTRSGALVCTTSISTVDGIFCTALTVVSQDIRTQSSGSVFTGSLNTKSESADWNFSLSRALQPSGSGGETEQDQFNFRYDKRLSPRAGFNLNGNVLKTRLATGITSNIERTYYSSGPGAYWHWTREWSVGADYRHARVKRDLENQSADSNSVSLWLTWRPLKMSISR